uniref:Uncharacterized protein n=1 Tax=Salix viminalis TaxID=40686 RepID=A0A6N2MHI4_SALVM
MGGRSSLSTIRPMVSNVERKRGNDDKRKKQPHNRGLKIFIPFEDPSFFLILTIPPSPPGGMEMEKSESKTSKINLVLPSLLSPTMAILLVLLSVLLSSPGIVSAGGDAFRPADEFLVNCGARNLDSIPDGRIFKTDKDAQGYLQTKQDILVSIPSANVSSPLYLSARIFKEDATYAFTLKSAGWHWVRLHFFPMNNTEFDLRTATFSNSAAFINAIEVVSAPDILISDQATSLFPVNSFAGLNNFGYEVVYRLNMGGPLITSENDTLWRRWVPDKPYLKHESMAKSASVPTSSIKYGPGISSLIAPATVYASAEQMADSETRIQNFNITWNFVADATSATWSGCIFVTL